MKSGDERKFREKKTPTRIKKSISVYRKRESKYNRREGIYKLYIEIS